MYSPGAAELLLLVDEGRLLGLIGIRPLGANCAEITHLTVQPALRGQEIGRGLVRQAMALASLLEVRAETDQGAVGFYMALGFEVQSLGERYPGVERFLCTCRMGTNPGRADPPRSAPGA